LGCPRWRVIAQGDALEGAERVTGGNGARSSGDQRSHRDRLLRSSDTALLLAGVQLDDHA